MMRKLPVMLVLFSGLAVGLDAAESHKIPTTSAPNTWSNRNAFSNLVLVGATGGKCLRSEPGTGKIIEATDDCGTGGSAGNPDWANITNKPLTFLPTAHTHGKSEITDFPVTWDWNAVGNKPLTFPPTAHNHLKSEISDFPATWEWASVANKPTNFQADWNTTVINKPVIPAAQVQPDWNAVSGMGQILNKPTIPAAQVQPDWNAVSGMGQILNKPTIPAAQVQPDWNAVSGMGQILNKPTIPTDSSLVHKTGDETVAGVKTFNSGIVAGTGSLLIQGTKQAGTPTIAYDFGLYLGSDNVLKCLLSSVLGGGSCLPAAGAADWNTLLNKPATFAPSAHTHGKADITDFPSLGTAAALNVGTTAGTVAAGDHNHSGVYEPANANITKLGPSIGASEVDADIATQAELDAKIEPTNKTCTGTDKISAYSNGTFTCSADQTGAGGGVAFRSFLIFSAAAAPCTWTNLGASYGECVNAMTRTNLDFSGFTDFRISFTMSVAASTGDIQITCSDTSGYASETLLVQWDNPASTSTLQLGAWAAIPAGCKTAGGVYIRTGMINGNGTEDPAMRRLEIQVR